MAVTETTHMFVPVGRMKKHRHITLIIFIPIIAVIVGLLAYYIINEKTMCYTHECEKIEHHLSNYVDETQDPCDNFYNYACGTYLKNPGNNLTYTKRYETDRIQNLLTKFIQEESSENDTHSVILLKNYYKSCMDLEAIEADNAATLKKIIRNLDGWPIVDGASWKNENFNFTGLIVKGRKLGLYFDWFVKVTSTYDSYEFENSEDLLMVDLPEVSKIERRYEQEYYYMLKKVVEYFGVHEAVSSHEVQKIINFEIELNQLVESIRIREDYKASKNNVMRIEQISSAKMDWLIFLKEITRRPLTRHDVVTYRVASYMPRLFDLIRKTERRVVTNYFIWKIVESYAPFLPKELRRPIITYHRLAYGKEDVDFDRKGYCTDLAKTTFQFIPEAHFARIYANEETREEVKRMLENICCSLKHRILKSTWMDEESKEKALRKLGNVKYVIGGPKEVFNEREFDQLLGYENMLLVNGNYLYDDFNLIDMTREIYLKEMDHQYNLGRKKVTMKKHARYNSMILVNGLFEPNENTLYIPAALLQGPFYNSSKPQYLNYGSLGVILGHEMAHGFGIMGSIYIEGNRTTNWWSGETRDNFSNRSQCLIQECKELQDKKFKVNCNQTLDENFSDYAGITLAYEAYQEWLKTNGTELKLPNFRYKHPNQLFFTTYATLICIHPVDQKTLNDESHLLPYQRIIGSYRNSKDFGENFGCGVDAKMNPSEKCIVL